jgi:hypothetical protein
MPGGKNEMATRTLWPLNASGTVRSRIQSGWQYTIVPPVPLSAFRFKRDYRLGFGPNAAWRCIDFGRALSWTRFVNDVEGCFRSPAETMEACRGHNLANTLLTSLGA